MNGTAALAGAGEGQLAIGHGSSGLTCRPAAQAFRDFHVGQVDDTVATLTDEVNMGINITVEPFHAIHRAETLDHTLLLKQRQVSVNGTQRNVRIFMLDLSINPISRRVNIGTPQASQNRISFFELLCSLLHRYLLFANDYRLHPYNSTWFPICQ